MPSGHHGSHALPSTICRTTVSGSVRCSGARFRGRALAIVAHQGRRRVGPTLLGRHHLARHRKGTLASLLALHLRACAGTIGVLGARTYTRRRPFPLRS